MQHSSENLEKRKEAEFKEERYERNGSRVKQEKLERKMREMKKARMK